MGKKQPWEQTRKVAVNLPVRVVEEFSKRYGSRADLITLAVTQYFKIDTIVVNDMEKLNSGKWLGYCPICKAPIIEDLEPLFGETTICPVCKGYLTYMSEQEKNGLVKGPQGVGSLMVKVLDYFTDPPIAELRERGEMVAKEIWSDADTVSESETDTEE